MNDLPGWSIPLKSALLCVTCEVVFGYAGRSTNCPKCAGENSWLHLGRLLNVPVRTDSGCWVWMGRRSPENYGSYSNYHAHRLIYQILVGPIPAGKELDHLCRNRPCVRPDHLEPVSRSVNARRRPATKLNEGQVEEIRQLRGSGEMGNRRLAKRFGVDRSHISRICNRKKWAEDKEEAVVAATASSHRRIN